MRTLGVAAWTLGTSATACGIGLGALIARKLTAPVFPRSFDLVIRDVEITDGERVVVLDRNRQTSARGTYSLLFADGGWAQLAAEAVDRGSSRVARVVTQSSTGLTPSIGDPVAWSGIFFTTPAAAGLAAQDVHISTPVGSAPASLIRGEGENASTWAIHIHGMGSPRSGPLRGARVASSLGLTSLIVSYRNDGEGPYTRSGRSMLGAEEVDDVDSALRYALEHGAQRIVLFGWSMGAEIALQLATHATRQIGVSAMVLESPVLDWIATIRANCRRAGIPAAAGVLAVPWLSIAPLARVIGLAGRIPFHTLNWIARARELTTPTLILHGSRDDSAPLHVSRDLAKLRPDIVHLEQFESAHTMTWNSDPQRWDAIVASWLTQQFDEI
ncbi:alpha/beta hydrolase family protein [Microbacterium pygmaeum]|uniref:Alpha/beta hydrolase family protein n=1 Tax=Microbacterium pygmaeum TaxID=370764 RepID=A0A1G7XIP1_9MICO|nr:alpha/beta hydrolase fold domain-containing protein [Microbacterium pygmaeum]SDG83976.1 Alpha/beta hydrolase family protein [Microbacterium pygmaeum]